MIVLNMLPMYIFMIFLNYNVLLLDGSVFIIWTIKESFICHIVRVFVYCIFVYGLSMSLLYLIFKVSDMIVYMMRFALTNHSCYGWFEFCWLFITVTKLVMIIVYEIDFPQLEVLRFGVSVFCKSNHTVIQGLTLRVVFIKIFLHYRRFFYRLMR